uniref:Major facilitator superfamily (MFS) profile domain-containing protein n=1 Tax=Panagrolaimus sp. JU765 TaxID=591449 RepID=A0AC34QH00_9BILA
MSLFSVSLVGNRFFNYVAIGLIEIPAVAAGPILLDKIGRRLTVSFTHLGTALAFILAAFTFTDSPMAQLMFWLTAKFAIAAAFMCIFAFASESFPTSERNMCIGICSVIGKLLGSGAPFIQMTSSVWTPLPLVIFASFSATAGLLALLLTETTHKQLPDSLLKIRNS